MTDFADTRSARQQVRAERNRLLDRPARPQEAGEEVEGQLSIEDALAEIGGDQS